MNVGNKRAGINPTANHIATQPLAVIHTRMNYNISKQRDPVTQAERDMSVLNADIDNNGGALYNPETFCIVHRFENDEEKERRKNMEDGYGEVSDFERHVIYECDFYESHQDDDWLFDEDTYARYNTYSDSYIEMVENGEIIDDGLSCRMTSFGTGSSFYSDGLDWGFDPYENPYGALYNDYNSLYEIDNMYLSSDLELSDEEGASIKPAEENTPATNPRTPSAAESAISSNINLSSQFASAATATSTEFVEPELSVAPQTTYAAANNPSYQRSA